MSNEQSGIDWAKAITAGAVATVAMTVVMMMFGMNIMLSMGTMMLGEEAGAMAYVAGGMMHFMIGIIYGIIYSVIAPKIPMPSIASGLLFGAVLTPVAMFSMPIVSNMMSGGEGGDNPCGGANPCASLDDGWSLASYQDENPCGEQNPCGEMNPCGEQNPCGEMNPCGEQNPCGEMNPCGEQNPCGQSASGDNPCGGANPCGAANPCAPEEGGMNPWVSSFINHLAFGLVLGLMYKPKGS